MTGESRVMEVQKPNMPAQPETILVVGMKAEIRAILHDSLSAAGYRVIEALNRQHADTLMNHFANRFDLILSCVETNGEASDWKKWHISHSAAPLLVMQLSDQAEFEFFAVEAALRVRLALEASRPSRSILVVDEHEPERKGIVGVLEAAGYRVTQAANGKQALLYLARNRPDLLLTDIVMAEMDGLELIQCVRKDYSTTAIIAMSEDHYLPIARYLGAHRTLKKPVIIDTLLRTLREVPVIGG